jgi:hypothetical protein
MSRTCSTHGGHENTQKFSWKILTKETMEELGIDGRILREMGCRSVDQDMTCEHLTAYFCSIKDWDFLTS